MSPRHEVYRHPENRGPRASGDEPFLEEIPEELIEWSPRERG